MQKRPKLQLRWPLAWLPRLSQQLPWEPALLTKVTSMAQGQASQDRGSPSKGPGTWLHPACSSCALLVTSNRLKASQDRTLTDYSTRTLRSACCALELCHLAGTEG